MCIRDRVEAHVVELDAAPRIGELGAVGRVDDRVGGVEHLEHPLEAHQRAHHVDPGVGEAGERFVDPGVVFDMLLNCLETNVLKVFCNIFEQNRIPLK